MFQSRDRPGAAASMLAFLRERLLHDRDSQNALSASRLVRMLSLARVLLHPRNLLVETRGDGKRIQRTHHPEPFRTGRDLQVDLGCCDVFVAENLLDGSQIGRRSEQVGCERVPQRMARHALLDPRRPCHAFDRFVLDLLVEVMTAPEGAFGIDR